MENDKQKFIRFEELYWQLYRDMGYIWKRIFEQHFPGSQSHIVFLLERRGPQKMSELAESLRLTPGAVTIASDKLIEEGYLERLRDENDRRVIFLQITDKGKETLNELRVEGRKAMKAVFSNLSDSDMQHLIKTFELAANNMNEIRGEYK